METVSAINVADLQRACAGQMQEPSLRALINALQVNLDTLLPIANREFANVMTEAYDLSEASRGLGVSDVLASIANIQNELDTLLFNSTGIAEMITMDQLPSPEMLFSDPDHVPRFLDWNRISAASGEHDLQWTSTHVSGISSNGSPYGLDGLSDRYDA